MLAAFLALLVLLPSLAGFLALLSLLVVLAALLALTTVLLLLLAALLVLAAGLAALLTGLLLLLALVLLALAGLLLLSHCALHGAAECRVNGGVQGACHAACIHATCRAPEIARASQRTGWQRFSRLPGLAVLLPPPVGQGHDVHGPAHAGHYGPQASQCFLQTPQVFYKRREGRNEVKPDAVLQAASVNAGRSPAGAAWLFLSASKLRAEGPSVLAQAALNAATPASPTCLASHSGGASLSIASR